MAARASRFLTLPAVLVTAFFCWPHAGGSAAEKLDAVQGDAVQDDAARDTARRATFLYSVGNQGFVDTCG